MSKMGASLAVIALSCALGSCSQPQPDKPVSVYDEMTKIVVPQTQAVWDVSNAAMDDDGNPSEAKMTPEAWAKARTATANVVASFNKLANAQEILVAMPGQKIMDEEIPEGAKASEVQARIAADADGFRKHAKDMAAFMKVIEVAAEKRDFKTFSDKSLELDGACEACHTAFWLEPTPGQ